MRHRAIVAVLSALPVVAGAQTTHSLRPVRFQSAVNVVQLNVSVTDGHRRYISGLGEGDFAVFEDGAPQAVSFFSDGGLPISLALLMDASASMEETLPVAQKAAVRFLATLRPRDVARVAQFNERLTVLQDFSADQAELERAVRGTRPEGTTALYTALYVTLRELRAAAAAGEARRRAIVLLSDGEDTVSSVTDEQVLELAQRADVTIYPIALWMRGNHERNLAVYDQAAHFLTRLARETGGEIHFPRSLADLDDVYGHIAEELRTQYTLGYVSANPARDGRWRQILVRTPARSGLSVRSRVGYYAPRG